MSGINISDHYWFALRSPKNRQFKAVVALQQRGLVTCVPYEMRKQRRSRHARATIRFPHAELGPYVFTGFPAPVPPWRQLFEDRELAPLINGVVSVTSDGLPTRVRPKAIFDMQVRYGAEVFEVPPRSRGGYVEEQELSVGDVVRVGQWTSTWSRGGVEFDEGGFAGKVVTIKEIRSDFAKVLMPMFGSEFDTWIPLGRLAAA